MKTSIYLMILMIAWLVLGVTMLIAGPTRIAYGCLLVCYLSELFIHYLYVKDKDDDDWGGFVL